MEKVKAFGGSGSVAVAATATKVLDIQDVGGYDLFSFDLYNSGAVALVACVVKKKYHPQLDARTFFGGADFSSTTNPNLEFVTTVKPDTLAGTANSQFSIWCSGCIGIEVWLTADTGGTTVVIGGNAQKK